VTDKAVLYSICLDCLIDLEAAAKFCPGCAGKRIARHPELLILSIAHLDCDAFYAAVEKRDDPSIADKPVIVGGGKRGVVTTACYIARTFGVRSAMPMFKALKACPDAIIIKPNFEKYSKAGRQVRAMMNDLTPLVEPISIDEAFMDLSGTERVHHMPPAKSLAALQKRVQREIGINVSIGLSHNKFLAKIASDLDKPRGFCVIGKAETVEFLARQPISLIWGVGAVMAAKLEQDGLTQISQLQTMDEATLAKRFGELGLRLAHLSRGLDYRRVNPKSEIKSVSSETTFNSDLGGGRELENRLWTLCEKVSRRMKKKHLQGRVVTLKLKTTAFKTLTRRVTLEQPSNLARTAFAAAKPLLHESAEGGVFRLIGVGFSDLMAENGSPQAELFQTAEARFAAQEKAIDQIRDKFGETAIAAGRTLKAPPN